MTYVDNISPLESEIILLYKILASPLFLLATLSPSYLQQYIPARLANPAHTTLWNRITLTSNKVAYRRAVLV